MADRKPNDIKIVAWLLVAKKLIKFANDETSYKISDNVMTKSNFDKFPLFKGDKVEVAITEGSVTYLRKQKNVEPKGSEEAYEPTTEEEKPKTVETLQKIIPAPVESEKPTTVSTIKNGDIKELTVYAIAANKKVVKFLECKDAGWFQIDESIQKEDYSSIGLIAKNKVNVQIVENKVVSLAKVASEPAEQPKTATSSNANAKVEPTAAPEAQASVQAPKKEWVPYNSKENDARQKSIECQACLNSANQVVGRIAANIDPKPTASVINAMIRAIAEENYKLLQELKKK